MVNPTRILTATGAETVVKASTTEQWIILTNVAIVLATLLLTWATMKDAHKTAREVVDAESKNTRLLVRLLRRSNQTSPSSKHKKQ